MPDIMSKGTGFEPPHNRYSSQKKYDDVDDRKLFNFPVDKQFSTTKTSNLKSPVKVDGQI